MKKKDAKDFASTKHKGKPEHVKEENDHYGYGDEDFDGNGNRIPIGADEAPKWTRSLFDHLFMKKGTKYDGPDRPFTKGDKEVFIPLVPAMIDKLVGGPTELNRDKDDPNKYIYNRPGFGNSSCIPCCFKQKKSGRTRS